MKKIISIIILLNLTMACVVRAQDDADATQAALTLLIQKHSVNADTIAKELSQKFRKDAAMQTAIARAYFRNNQEANTRKYLHRAIGANDKYAPAYILYGELFGEWKPDSASFWFNKAIAAEPQNPDGYLRYARVNAAKNMDLAKAKLEELRRVRPTYDVDAAIAELYNLQGDDKAAAAAFAAADPNNLTMTQLAHYVQNLYWTQQDEKAMQIATIAMERFPGNKGFNRVYSWSAIRLGMYSETLKQAKIWYDNAPKDSINSIDIFCLGSAHLGLGETDKAFSYYSQIADMTDYFAPQMKGQITRMVSNVVDERKGDGNYDKAAEIYSRFIDLYPSDDRALQLYQLAAIYRDAQENMTGEEKQNTIGKMFEIYKEIETKYPDWKNIHFVLYTHARWTYAYFDKENEQSLALPYYNKLYDVLSIEANPNEQQKAMLVEACQYMASDAYFQKDDTATARLWWTRILKYDPDNESAKDALAKIKR